MTTRTETETEKNMDQTLDKLDPSSYRFKVLNIAKKFKSNWLDLGKLLTELISKNNYQEWGYDNFDLYLKKELKIKPETAHKLIASFGYLKKYRPQLTQKEEVLKPVPDFKVINKLQEAEENFNFKDEEINELRESVFEQNFTPAKLNKAIKQITYDENEDSKINEEEQLLIKMQKAIETLKKILPIFEPDSNTLGSINDLEDFITKIEI